MSKYMVDGTDLTSIADAIREKTGSSEQIEFPTGFVNGISGLYASISTGTIKSVDIQKTGSVAKNQIVGAKTIPPSQYVKSSNNTISIVYAYFLKPPNTTSLIDKSKLQYGLSTSDGRVTSINVKALDALTLPSGGYTTILVLMSYTPDYEATVI